jgi:hypothetical protein
MAFLCSKTSIASRAFLSVAWVALALGAASAPAQAAVALGTGYSSITDVRQTPILHLGMGSDLSELSLHATGVRTAAYSITSWSAAYFRLARPGRFLWGTWNASLGWGLTWTNRQLIELGDTSSVHDWVTGPAIKMRWQALGPLFVSLESVFGLRDPSLHLTLNFQTVTHALVGVRL